MKKTILMLLCLVASMGAWAVDWGTIGWLGNGSGDAAYTNKYKISIPEGVNVANIQTPGFATGTGIYMSFPDATYVDGITVNGKAASYATQGAGICLYMANFDLQENEIVAKDKTIYVYYADGQKPEATASTGNAAAGCDGNTGTRWESASTDSEWWMVNYHRPVSFNTIKINWEGAYSKEFTLEGSNNGTDWDVLYTETNQTSAGIHTYDIGSTVSYQYVKINITKRATGWGNSFWEFEVYVAVDQVVTNLSLASASAVVAMGQPCALTVTAKDQYGVAMDPGVVAYSVSPADAGTFDGNNFIASKTGNITITATSENGVNASTNVYAVSNATNLAFSSNIGTDNKVIAQSEFAPNGTDAFFAVDGNEGSVWQGSATNGTAGDETSRTFDSWFTVDLGGKYNLELVKIKFEGACSQNYTVEVSKDNTNWEVAYTYAMPNGAIYGHEDLLYSGTTQQYVTDNGADLTAVRYVKFHSTKAATEWGMKMYEFMVYGTEWVPVGDEEAPVMVSASLVSKTWNSAVLAVEATDNTEVARYHVVDATNGIDKKVAAAAQITIGDLTATTDYTFTVTAIDVAGNESANSKEVAVTTDVHYLAPQTAAPVPAYAANQVMAVYSDAYASNSIIEKHAGWGDATIVTEENIDGDNHLKASNLNWWGWTLYAMDVTEMEYLHIDIWASENGKLGIVPIYGGAGLSTDDSKRKIVDLVGQQWNSFDLKLDEDFAGLDLSSIFQFKFDNATGDVFALDNVYFYKRVTDVTVGEAGYATFVAPWDIEKIPEGVEAYAATVNGSSVHLEAVEQIPEGTAVVLKNEGTFRFVESANAVSLDTANDLTSSHTDVTADGTQYVLAQVGDKVGFHKVTSGTTIAAGKGYLVVPAGAKTFFAFDDETTGIKQINNADAENAVIYNLNGQRVSNAERGLYIVNGKKVLVK